MKKGIVTAGQTTTVEAAVVTSKHQRGSGLVFTTPSIMPGTKTTAIKSSC